MINTGTTNSGIRKTADAPFLPGLSARQKAALVARNARNQWKKARAMERQFGTALSNVGQQIGTIIKGMATDDPTSQAHLQETLRRYAELIAPWARSVVTRMHHDVALRDWRAWRSLSASIGKNLHKTMTQGPSGDRIQQLMGQQVDLIKTIPLDAARDVHKLVMKSRETSERADTLIDAILKLGSDQRWKARRIARTEIARTNTVITQTRAEKVGSTHYIWRTMQDKVVRPDHRELEGTTQAWAEPPIADTRTGARAHPGSIYNCRCYPEPVLPSD